MKSIKKFSSILSVFAILFAFAFTTNTAFAQDGTVVEVVKSSEDHTIFAELLSETELDQAIADEGPYTIVAPTDAAFESLDEDLEELRSDPDRLQNILISHLFQGEVQAGDAEPALGVTITEGDIPATNGLVHVTDEVIQ